MRTLGSRAGWLLAAVLGLGVTPSAAQPAPGGSAPGTIGGCMLRGRGSVPKDLPLYDKAKDGRPIARFTGVETPLTAYELPADAAQTRTRVHTGAGVGGFRLDGFVDGKQLPLTTLQRASVVERHVSIDAGQPVELVGVTSGGRVRVKKTLQSPLEVSVTANVPCRVLGLGPSSTPSVPPPGNARGHVLEAAELVLYDSPEARQSSVLHVRKAPNVPGVLFWSSEQRAGFVRVEYQRGLVIDAWAKATDLVALPPGETIDEPHAEASRTLAPKLLLDGNARLRRVASETPIRSAPRDNGPVIGAIEAAGEVYVIDVITGWASVLPRALSVEPHGDARFWVEAKALGF